MKKKIYYNPYEVPNKVRYVSVSNGIDITFTPMDVPEDYPLYFDDLFKALRTGQFDEIYVDITAYNDCYYPEKQQNGLYNRVFVSGNIELSEYCHGGGYLKDNHFYNLQQDSTGL